MTKNDWLLSNDHFVGSQTELHFINTSVMPLRCLVYTKIAPCFTDNVAPTKGLSYGVRFNIV